MARRDGLAALALLLVLAATPATALAQRDVGPVRVALFAGVHLGHDTRPLLGLAGELELRGTWSLAIVASTLSQRDGTYAQYEVEARWRPLGEGRVRPYLGAGAVAARSSFIASGGPATTRFGALALAGVEVPLLGTTSFLEALALEDGGFSAQLRGGVRLLLIGK